jgi:hypothetical protein
MNCQEENDMNEETKTKIVDALRGSQIGAIAACALGVETTGPRYTSTAIVTSDGFVQANFVDQNEVSRHSAFVGSYDELLDNLRSVQGFLRKCIGIGEDQLGELWDAVAYRWIATDYRS